MAPAITMDIVKTITVPGAGYRVSSAYPRLTRINAITDDIDRLSFIAARVMCRELCTSVERSARGATTATADGP